MAYFQQHTDWQQQSTHPYLQWVADVGSSAFRDERIKNVVHLINASPMSMSIVDFFLEILSSCSMFPQTRTKFMRSEEQVGSLLNLIVKDKDGQATFDKWLRREGKALEIVCEDVQREMDLVKPKMKKPSNSLTANNVMEFDFEARVQNVLHSDAPSLHRVLKSAAQTSQAASRNTLKNPEFICSVVFAQLCNSRSKQSLVFQHIMGFFLFSTSTSRILIDFLSNCGLSSGYNTILKAHKALSASFLQEASAIAQGPHMLGFDNEQICMSIHVLQRPGALPAVRSFTASIVYKLRNATAEACRLQPILDRRKSCELITYEDHIKPTQRERQDLLDHFLLDIIDILFKNVKGFQTEAYSKILKHKTYRPPPEGHKTEEYINPTIEIDESKTIGVIEFNEYLYLRALKVPEDILDGLAIPCVNDQLSNSRDRSAYIERRGDENAFLRMENFQLGVGFFHALMNLIWHLRLVHLGGSDVVGSLSYWIKVLGTKRVSNERPDYYTLRTFLLDVLYGNIISCWQRETGIPDLEQYAQSGPSFDELKRTAYNIWLKYTSDQGLETCKSANDNLLYNVILLNRDLLAFYEFDKAVSSGDFGRLELQLGALTRMFNGAGAKNYSLELLHLIQNLRISWPEEFANIMRDNMLISVQGHRDHYMGVDLNMEHNVNYQKRHFAGRGVHGTAKYLADITPATKAYRQLRKLFCTIAGVPWRGSNHTDPNRAVVVAKIVHRINEENVYELQPGRNDSMGSNIKTTKDILHVGGESLKRTGMRSFGQKYRDWASKKEGAVLTETDSSPLCGPPSEDEALVLLNEPAGQAGPIILD